MVWVKLDDAIGEHPKIAGISDSAFALFVTGLAYCNRNLTDGFIPSPVGFGQLRYCDGNAVPSIRELEEVGLWHPKRGGWMVHDFAEYQPTKAAVLAEKEAKSRAGRAGGLARARAGFVAPAKAPAQTDAKAPAKAPAQAHAQAESKPVPVPVPVGTGKGTESPSPDPAPEAQPDRPSAAAAGRPENPEPDWETEPVLGRDFSIAEVQAQQGLPVDPPTPGRYVPPPPDEIEARRARTKAQLEAAMTPEEREAAERLRGAK